MTDPDKNELKEKNFSLSLKMTDKYPIKIGDVKKGGFIILNDRPCKVIDISVSKTGKHGHAKAHLISTDIFNGCRYELIKGTDKEIWAPEVKRQVYTLVDIDEDGYISLMDEANQIRHDFNFKFSLAELYFSDTKLIHQQISQQLDDTDSEINVVILAALNIEMIIEFKY